MTFSFLPFRLQNEVRWVSSRTDYLKIAKFIDTALLQDPYCRA